MLAILVGVSCGYGSNASAQVSMAKGTVNATAGTMPLNLTGLSTDTEICARVQVLAGKESIHSIHSDYTRRVGENAIISDDSSIYQLFTNTGTGSATLHVQLYSGTSGDVSIKLLDSGSDCTGTTEDYTAHSTTHTATHTFATAVPLPIASIKSDAGNTNTGNTLAGVTEGQSFDFTVGLSLPRSVNTIVKYSVSSGDTSKVKIHNPANLAHIEISEATITIPAGELSATETVTLQSSTAVDDNTIYVEVRLASGTGYSVHSTNSADLSLQRRIRVYVKDNDGANDNKVSIAAPTTTAYFEGETITFKVSSTAEPASGTPLTVNYIVEEIYDTDKISHKSQNNFIRPGQEKGTVTLMNGTGNYTDVDLTVKTGPSDGNSDSVKEAGRMIKVSLRDGDGSGYVLADTGTSATVSIADKPKFHIEMPAFIDENAVSVQMYVVSDTPVTSRLRVPLKVKWPTGTFGNSALFFAGRDRSQPLTVNLNFNGRLESVWLTAPVGSPYALQNPTGDPKVGKPVKAPKPVSAAKPVFFIDSVASTSSIEEGDPVSIEIDSTPGTIDANATRMLKVKVVSGPGNFLNAGSSTASDKTYDSNTKTLTIPVAPSTTGTTTVSITTFVDGFFEDPGTLTVSIEPHEDSTAADYYEVGGGVHTVSVTDNGTKLDAATLAFRDGDGMPIDTLPVQEDIEGGLLEVPVVLDNQTPNVTFDWELVGGTAVADTNYAYRTEDSSDASRDNVRLDSDNINKTITVKILPNDTKDGDKTFRIKISDLNPTTGAVQLNGGGNEMFLDVTIKEDDHIPTVSIAKMVTVPEDVLGEKAIVRVSTRNYDTSTAELVKFDYDTVNSTALSGHDYTPKNEDEWEIPKDVGYRDIEIDITNDSNKGENLETFQITLSELKNARFSEGEETISSTVTIEDDDDTTTLYIDAQTLTFDENVGTARIKINAENKALGDAISFNYRTIDGTAESGMGKDFIGISSTSGMIAANSDHALIDVTINDDRVLDGTEPEKFQIELSNPAVVGNANKTVRFRGRLRSNNDPLVGEITITDNEVPPVITVTNPTEPVRKTEGHSFELEISAEPTPYADLMVRINDAGGLLTVDPNPIPLPDGQMTETATVTVGDISADSTLLLIVAVPDDVSFITRSEETSSVVVNALTNDMPTATNPKISIARKTETQDEIIVDSSIQSPQAQFVITSDPIADPTGSAKLDIKVMVTETGNGDFIASSLEGEKTVTLSDTQAANDYNLDITDTQMTQGRSTIKVEILEGTGYTLDTPANSSAEISVTNVPLPLVTVAAGTSPVNEGDTIEFTFTVDNAPAMGDTLPITFEVTESGNFIGPGPHGPVVFEHGQPTTKSLSIQTTSANNTYDPDSKVRVEIDDTGGTYRSSSQGRIAEVTVLDDFTPTGTGTGPVISVIKLSDSVTEAATGADQSTAKFQVRRTGGTMTGSLSVNLTVTEQYGNFIVASDEGDKTFTIPAGERTGVYEVPIVSDANAEPDSSVSVTVAAPTTQGNYAVAGSPNNTAEILLLDDDVPEVVGNENDTVSIYPLMSSVTEGSGSPDTFAKFQVKVSAADMASARTINISVDGGASDFIDTSVTYNTVTISAGERASMPLEVKLLDNGFDEPDGTITATVMPSGGSSTTYTVAESPHNTASVSVVDDEVPVVTLSKHNDVFADDMGKIRITEGYGFGFSVTATPAPHQDLAVEITPSVTGGGAVPVSITGGNTVTLAGYGNTPTTEAKTVNGTVQANQNVTTDSEFTLTVADSSDGSYQKGTADNAELDGIVLDNDSSSVTKPNITVERLYSVPVQGGLAIKFRAVASHDPSEDLEIRYAVSHTGVNFIALGSRAIGSVDLDTTHSENHIDLTIATLRDPNAGTPDSGNVKVTLLDGLHYTVADASNLAEVQDNSAEVTVNDSDPVVSVTSAADSVAEGGNVVFEFTSEPIPREPLPVTISVVQTGNFLQTAPSGTNYEETLDFAMNVESDMKTELVFRTKPDNSVLDPDGSVTLAIVDGTGYSGNSQSKTATVEILDDDSPSGISIVAQDISVAEEDSPNTATATFQVKSDMVDAQARTINVSVADGYVGKDGVLSGTTGTDGFVADADRGTDVAQIPADEKTGIFTVNIVSDDDFEPDGEIVVTVEASSGSSSTYTVATGNDSAAVGVEDDDAPAGISIVAVTERVTEGDPGGDAVYAQFQITSDTPLTSDTPITLTVDDGTADVIDDTGGDGTGDPYSPRTISMDNRTAILSVLVANDNTEEAEGVITATVADPGDGSYTVASASSSAAVTVVDDDVPVLTIEALDQPAGVADQTVRITEQYPFRFRVVSDTAPRQSLPVTLEISGSSLTAPSLSIPASPGTYVDGTLTPADVDGNLSFTISIAAGSNYLVGTASMLTVNVLDNDSGATENVVSIQAALDRVKAGAPAKFNLVSTIPPTTGSANLTVADSGQLIASGASGPKTQAFVTNNMTTEYDVTTMDPDDQVDHDDSTVTVTLREGLGYARPNSPADTATVTVTDDNPVITVAADDSDSTVNEGDDVVFVITADPPPVGAMDVMFAVVEEGNFITAADLSGSSVSFSANQQKARHVLNTIAANSVADPDSRVTLTLTDGADYDLHATDMTTRMATVLVLDDSVPSDISVIAVKPAVNEGDLKAKFQVRSDMADASARIINISIDDGKSDFIKNSVVRMRTETIPANRRSVNFDVELDDDSDFEANGEVTVTVEASGGASSTYTVSSVSTASVAVTDNDTPTGGISIVAVEDTVTEGPDVYAVFQITASETSVSARDIVVEFGDGDFEVIHPTANLSDTSPKELPAGAMSVPFRIRIHDDSVNDPVSTITASISATGSGYTLAGSNTSATVTVLDNDLPVLTIERDFSRVGMSAQTNRITEGYSFDFTITSTPEPAEPLTVNLTPTGSTVTISPETIIVGTDGTASGTVTTQEVSADETLTLAIGNHPDGNYEAGASLTATVLNNDSVSVPVISIEPASNGLVLTQATAPANDAGFTINSSIAPNPAVSVNLFVEETGNLLDDAYLGNGIKTHSVSGTVGTYTVETDNGVDGTDDDNSTVTVTVLDGTGYVLADISPKPNNSAQRTLSDDDPTLAIPAVSFKNSSVDEGGMLELVFTIDPAPSSAIDISYSIAETGSFIPDSSKGTMKITSGTAPNTTTEPAAITLNLENSDFEPDSVVTVRILPDDDTAMGGTYGLGTLEDITATATIRDGDAPSKGGSAPTISVIAVNGEVAESDALGMPAMVGFQIRSDMNIADSGGLDVNILVSEGNGSFLENRVKGNRVVSLDMGDRAAVYSIPILSDSTYEADADISVTVMDPATSGDYVIADSPNNTDSVKVLDDDVPTGGLSIVAVRDSVKEGEFAEFQITTDTVDDANATTVNLTLDVDNSSLMTGQVLDIANSTGLTANTSYPNFTATIPAGSRRSEPIMVKTADNSLDHADVTVTATLQTGSGYTLAEQGTLTIAPTAAMVVIGDDEVPELAMSPTSLSVTEGGSFEFTVTSNLVPYQELTIPIGVSIDGSVVTSDSRLTLNQPLTIAAGTDPATVTGTVTVTDGFTADTTLAISIGDSSDGRYAIGSASSLDAMVLFNDNPDGTRPNISISRSATHRVQAGGDVSFTIESTHDPDSDLSVNFEVGEGDEAYFNFTENPPPVSFTSAESTTNNMMKSFTLTTVDPNPGVNDADREITLKVVDGSNYRLGSQRTVTFFWSDDLPEVTVRAKENSVNEGNPVVFEFISDPAPAATIQNVAITVVEQPETFLTAASAATATVDLDANKNVTELSLATKPDNGTLDANSIVTVTITPVTPPGTTYAVGTSSSAMATVRDGDVPEGISVLAVARVVNEPAVGTPAYAEFRLRSDTTSNINRTINISIADGYIGTDGFVAFTGTDGYIADSDRGASTAVIRSQSLVSELIQIAIQPDAVFEPNGRVIVTVEESTDTPGSPGHYVKAATNASAYVTVVDSNLPTGGYSILPLKSTYNETDGNALFQIASDSAVSGDTTVAVTVDDGTADFLGDPHESPVIMDGGRSTILSVPLDDDNVHEESGMVTVQIQNAAERAATHHSASVTVESDDIEPVISIASLGQDGFYEGETVEFEITTADGGTVSSNELMISVEIVPVGTFFAVGEETTRTETVSLPALATRTANLGITTVADTDDESDGSVTVTIQDGTGYSPAPASNTDPDNTAMVAVLDNDGADMNLPVVTVTTNLTSIYEGHNAIFEVAATKPAGTETTLLEVVVRAGSRGEFISGEARSVVEVNTGESAMHVIATVPDDVDESDGSVTATLLPNDSPTVSGRGDYSVGVAYSATVAVMDNDDPALPSISISAEANSISEGESAGFKVSLPQGMTNETGSALEVIIEISQTGDFLMNAAGVRPALRIPVDASESSFHMEPTRAADGIDENDGRIVATISPGATYSVGAAHSAQVAVMDVDLMPTLSLGSTRVLASESDGTLSFAVELSAVSKKAVAVDFSISEDIAMSPEDFSLNSTPEWIAERGSDWRLVFDAGVQRRTIGFTIVDDSITDYDEEFSLTFSNPVNAVFGRGASMITAIGFIEDNEPDDRPVVTVAIKDVTETDRYGNYVVDENENSVNDGNGSFEITLSIDAIPQGVTEVVVNNLKAANTKGNYSINQDLPDVTFDSSTLSVDMTVDLDNNSRYDGWGIVTVGFSGTNEYKASLTVSENNIPVTIRDDELSRVRVSATAQPVRKGEDIVVTLAATPATFVGILDIEFSVEETGAVTGFLNDYTPKEIILDSTNPSKTFTISTNDPTTPEDGEISVALKRGDGYEPASATPLAVAVTEITTIVSAEAPASAFEGDAIGVLIRTTKAPGTGNSLTIGLSIAETGTTRGFLDGYTPPANVILTGMETSKTLIIDTAVVSGSGDGQITLTLNTGSEYRVETATYPISILDSSNDSRPTISIEAPERVEENVAGGRFSVTLRTGSPPPAPFTISRAVFIAVDTEGSYLGAQPTDAISIDATGVGRADVVLADNNTYDGWGTVTLKLLNGPNHKVGDLPATEITEDVVIVDDEDAPTRISMTVPQTVLEGEQFNVVLTSSESLANGESLTIDLSIAETGTVTGFFNDGDFAVEGDQTPNTVEITGPGNSVVVAVTTIENDDTPGNGRLTMTMRRGDGYEVFQSGTTRVAMVTRAVTILDNDTTTPTVSVSEISSTIEEGSDAEFRIAAFPAPTTATVLVNLNVSQVGNYIALFAPTIVELSSSQPSRIVAIATDDDFIDEDPESGSITLRLTGATGDYSVSGIDGIATVTVNDNDDATDPNETRYSVAGSVIVDILRGNTSPGEPTATETLKLPSVSIAAATGSVEEGGTAVFKLSASMPAEEELKISITLTDIGNFIGGNTSRIVNIVEGSDAGELNVATINDNHAGSDGSIVATVSDGYGYVTGSESTAKVVVTDIGDREARMAFVTEGNQAVFSNVIGSIGARSLDTATNRVTSALSEGRGIEFEFGGNTALKDFIRQGGHLINDEEMDSWQKVLGDSSFEFELFPEKGAASFAKVWGHGDFRDMSADGGDAGKLGGDMFTGHLGFDTLIGDGMVAGLTTSHSRGELDYGTAGGETLNYTTRTTGVHPYLGLETSDGNRLQVIAGYGLGGIELDQEGYETELLDSSYASFGASGSRMLYSSDSLLFGGTSELSLEGESWMARQFLSSDSDVIGNMRTDARHLRISTVGTDEHELESGSTASSSVSIGLREDGKRGESFLGMEMGGGIDFTSISGYEISTKGEVLFTGTDRVQEWGMSGLLSYDSANDGKGLILDVAPEWGRNMLISDNALWGDSVLVRDFDSGMHTDGAQVSAEIGYGLTVPGDQGLVKPYGGILLSETQDDRYHIGTKLTFESGFGLELKGSQTHKGNGTENSEINLEGSVRW